MTHTILGAAEPEPEMTLTIKTSEQIDRELVDGEVDYMLKFLHEQGLHLEAEDLSEKLKRPTIRVPADFMALPRLTDENAS